MWISPWLIGFLAFLAAPIVLSLYYSLTDFPLLEPPVWAGVENYRRLVGDPVFARALWNTAIYALVSIPVGTVLAVAIASLLHQPVRGTSFFRAMVFLPSLVPVVATAMIWLWLYNGELGLINRLLDILLQPLGLQGPNWLAQGGWAMTALIALSLWGVGPAVVIYLAALGDVPAELQEAAALDGLGPWRRFRHITLPMISPVILFNVIIAIINAWQVFAVPYIMTGGGPDRATYFYTMYLYDSAFAYGDMGYACAMAWVQLVILLLVTALTLRLSRRFVFYRAA